LSGVNIGVIFHTGTKCFIIAQPVHVLLFQGDTMYRKWIMLASVAVLVLLAGCLGSDDGSGGGGDEPVIGNGELSQAGTHTGLAQISPVETEVTVPITLDYDTVIGIMVNITIVDGDDGTDPDQVGTITLSEVEGTATGTANGGTASPGSEFVTSILVEWNETGYMSGRWDLHIPVSIVAGPDTWPGPFLWTGVPDNGFSYDLVITYRYHEEEAA
jgi:hypothetical protein